MIKKLVLEKEIEQIKIGTPADYAPFSYKNNLNNYAGFEIDLIKHIFLKLKTKVQFIKTTWYELETDLELNKFDMAIGGISLTENRKQKFLTSIPILADGKTLLICKKHANTIKSLADADNKMYTIIENRGGTNEKFVNENIKNAKISIIDDNPLIFEKLANGEADVMITDLLEALYRQSLDERLMVAQPITIYTKPLGYGFIYNKNKENLKNEVNTLLHEFMQLKQFKILYNKYFKTSQNTKLLSKNLALYLN